MRYKISKEIVFKKVNGRISIFEGEGSVLIHLNETATFIFELIKKKFSQEKIIDKLINQYQVSRKEARLDTKNIISKLIKNKIVFPYGLQPSQEIILSPRRKR